MASFEEAITAFLNARQSITALAGARSYDSELPPDTAYPAITWQTIGDKPMLHSKGQEAAHPVLVQVDAWALTPAARRSLAGVLRAELTAWRGDWGGIRVTRAFLVPGSPFNTKEDWAAGTPLSVFRNTSRWNVWVVEPAYAASL